MLDEIERLWAKSVKESGNENGVIPVEAMAMMKGIFLSGFVCGFEHAEEVCAKSLSGYVGRESPAVQLEIQKLKAIYTPK